jgi:hypothetical protein
MKKSGEGEEIRESKALQVIGDLAGQAAGLPLPPVVKRNLWKAIGGLIAGVFDIPAAWLESKAQGIRDDIAGRSLVAGAAAKAAATQFGADEKLVSRAVRHFGARLLREQTNRESVAVAALESLKSDPPLHDATSEVDQDWLDLFSRIAETRSDKDVQLYLGKLLAGEIRKPGSFSPITIQVLATLSPDTGRAYQEFANISMRFITVAGLNPFVLSDPFGNPANNALAPVGFLYPKLTQLQDAGLIQTDLFAWQDVEESVFATPIELAGRTLNFDSNRKDSNVVVRLHIINFTRCGIELRQILHCQPNEVYLSKFINWVHGKFGFTLEE